LPCTTSGQEMERVYSYNPGAHTARQVSHQSNQGFSFYCAIIHTYTPTHVPTHLHTYPHTYTPTYTPTHTSTHTHRGKSIVISMPPYYVVGADNHQIILPHRSFTNFSSPQK